MAILKGIKRSVSNWFTRGEDHLAPVNQVQVESAKIRDRLDLNLSLAYSDQARLDTSFNAFDIFNTARDTAPLANKIKESVLKDGYTILNDERGLISHMLEVVAGCDFLDDVFNVYLGGGGGDGLIILEKADNFYGVQLRVIPFYSDGCQQIKVCGENGKTTAYEYTLENNLTKVKYQADEVIRLKSFFYGSAYYTANPVKIASKYYLVKRLILDSLYRDSSKVANSKNIVSISEDVFKEYFKDANQFKKLTQIFDDITRKISQHTEGVAFSPIPLDEGNTNVTNKQDWVSVLKYLDESIAGCFATSLSILGRTEGVNYSNAESNKDNFTGLVVQTYQVKIKNLLEKEVLPSILRGYDKTQNPVIFGYEPDKEDLEIRQQTLDLLKTISSDKSNIPDLLNNMGLSFDKAQLKDLFASFNLPLVEQTSGDASKIKITRTVSPKKGAYDFDDFDDSKMKQKVEKAISNQIKKSYVGTE